MVGNNPLHTSPSKWMSYPTSILGSFSLVVYSSVVWLSVDVRMGTIITYLQNRLDHVFKIC